MATKRKISKASSPSSIQPLTRLQAGMRNLQRDAEKLLQKTRKQASAVITRDQQKAIDRIIEQARKLRKDLEHRARRASREIEVRTEKFLRAMEKEASQRLSSVLSRIDVPSRTEIRSLTRRLDDLEKKVKSATPRRQHTPKSAPPPSTGPSLL